jgi:hypothetical protein
LRIGDTAATDVRVLSVPSKDRPAVFGFVTLVASLSAQQLTDGQISRGMAELVAGPKHRALAAAAVNAGLLTMTDEGWQLLNDPDLIHVMSRDEVEWNRSRHNDRRNPALMAPVRYKWGDSCCWCGQAVSWRDRKGARGATLEHLNPGQPAASPDEAAIACRGCNSRRKNNPDALELRQPPSQPIYGEDTLDYLERHSRHLTKAQKAKVADLRGSAQITEISPKSDAEKSAYAGYGGGVLPGTGSGPGSGPGSGRARDGSGPDLQEVPNGSR